MSTHKKNTSDQTRTKTNTDAGLLFIPKEIGSITCPITPVFPDNFEEELIQAMTEPIEDALKNNICGFIIKGPPSNE